MRQLDLNLGQIEYIDQSGLNLKDVPSEYNSWIHMNDRCYNKKNKAYARYGGRGIQVCPQWRKDIKNGFQQFLSDMGLKPKGFQIDRIDNDKNYEPSNCQWLSQEDNLKKKSNIRHYEIDNGKTKEILPEYLASRKTVGCGYAFANRRKAGWPIERYADPIGIKGKRLNKRKPSPKPFTIKLV